MAHEEEFTRGMEKLLGSREYKDTRKLLGRWKREIEGAGRRETKKILMEKNAFFSKMEKENMALYLAFRIEDNRLGAMAFKNLTGRSAIIG
jgi:hypothetical protein